MFITFKSFLLTVLKFGIEKIKYFENSSSILFFNYLNHLNIIILLALL